MRIALIIVGGVVALTGILLGNISADQIFNEISERNKTEQGMFATSEEIDADGYKTQRARAIQQYRSENPDGKKFKSVRAGQVLTVVGMLIAASGAFFK